MVKKESDLRNMLTKEIQFPKIVFDTNILKIGNKVKLYKGECNLINGKTIWTEEYECIIDNINEDIMILIDVEPYGSCEGHNIFYVNAEDIQAEVFKKIELIEE